MKKFGARLRNMTMSDNTSNSFLVCFKQYFLKISACKKLKSYRVIFGANDLYNIIINKKENSYEK